ncbi:hypothetical protein [Brevibacillus sp. DP1.3A]|uniref:hypothetical protein n=1 Tax=Brevibacillus sp. DP1.3A TaxID=2738867 RepID=UPI00156B6DCC|nr:hypothetical protein [Brevibacillus sp. DP1.3A]UED73541.1 hypothetical protein HP399_022845 [Brevibacillus sp. DP1.3A]
MAELRVSLWAGRNFEARRIRFRRRGVAVRQCQAFEFMTTSQIREIQRTRTAPRNVVEIRT